MKTALMVFFALYGVIATFHIFSMYVQKRKALYEQLHPAVEKMNKHGHKYHIVTVIGVVVTHPTFLETAKEFTMHVAAGLVHVH